MGRKREILGEEVFYGGGKEGDPRRKETESVDQRTGELGDQSKGRGSLDQRRHWKEKDVFGKEKVSRIEIIKAPWTRVLFDDD